MIEAEGFPAPEERRPLERGSLVGDERGIFRIVSVTHENGRSRYSSVRLGSLAEAIHFPELAPQ